MFTPLYPYSTSDSVVSSGSYISASFRRTTFVGVICCLLILSMILLLYNSRRAKDQNSEGAPAGSETATREPEAQARAKFSKATRSESSSATFERFSRFHAQTQHRISKHGRSIKDVGVKRERSYTETAAQLASGSYRDGLSGSNKDGPNRTEDLNELFAMFENSEPSKRAQAVWKLWVLAADMDVPEEALEALDYLMMYDSDHKVAEKAARAAADLRRLKEEAYNAELIFDSEVATEEHYEQDQIEYGIAISAADGRYETAQYESNEEDQEPTQQEVISNAQVEELAEQALWDSSEANRYDAIRTLALYRSDAAVDVLIQASMDSDARNRFKAIEGLWFSAADGLDKDGNIWFYLQQAMGDSDERVSELVAKALTDLDHLEAARSE